MAFEIFGFKIERKSEEQPNARIPAFALPENEDGSMMIAGGGAYGSYLNMEGAYKSCLLYTSPSPRDLSTSRMPSSA